MLAQPQITQNMDSWTLDPEQTAFATSQNRLIALKAPPGSGKTHALAARFAHGILHQGIAPERILVCTFTNRARDAFQERLKKHLPQLADRLATPDERRTRPQNAPSVLWVGTFHDTCRRIGTLHTWPRTPGTDDRTMSEAEQRERMRVAMLDTGILPQNVGIADKEITDAINLLSKLKRRGIDITAEGATRQFEIPTKAGPAPNPQHGWTKALLRYGRDMRTNHRIDPDDIILGAWFLLNENGDAQKAWSQRWDMILVDEYQDTDPLVTALLRILGVNSHIAVVGDADQAIYGWRDAIGSFDELHVFQKTHGAPHNMTLLHDYRLSRPIQEASGKLRALLKDSHDQHQDPVPSSRSGPPCVHVEYADDTQQGQVLINTVHALAAPYEPEFAEQHARSGKSRYHDIAVLARTKKQAARAAQELSTGNIPVWLASESAMTPTTQAYVNWGRLLPVALRNNACVKIALAGPPFYVPQGILDDIRVEAIARGIPLAERLNQHKIFGSQLPESLTSALQALEEVDTLEDQPWDPAQTLERIARILNLDIFAGQESLGRQRAWAEIRRTATQLSASAASAHHLADLLDNGTRSQESPKDHVEIRTMHSAKGMEWKHVLAVGWFEGSFPKGWYNDADEERHLAYVTITRASHTFASFSPRSMPDGTRTLPSRYVNEAGFKLIDRTPMPSTG